MTKSNIAIRLKQYAKAVLDMEEKKKKALAGVCILGCMVLYSSGDKSSEVVVTGSEVQIIESGGDKKVVVADEKNVLFIPKLDIYSEISEGEYEEDKDFVNTWRRTFTSTPDEGSNTVIVGHRYRDNTPGYHLYDIDRLDVGDELVLFWEDKEYTYNIFNTQEVHETAIEIEDPTEKHLVTLYACDWTGKKRLVVQAELVEKNSRDENPKTAQL